LFDTPLRYPGGKGRLTQFVIDLIEMNELTGGDYAEPYAGGAAIGITLLYLEYVERVHLNDLSAPLFAFWRSVLEEPEALCKLICDTSVTVDEWRRQKAVQSSLDPSSLDLGFSTFFLNRTNRSGILAAGIIGGKNQKGNWRLDARYNKNDLTKRILKIASYSPRISLYNLDAAVFVSGPLSKYVPQSALVYLDPPYFVKGGQLYENHYQAGDHAVIAELVKGLRQKWIVTYDNVDPIRELYSGFRQQTFSLHYSAQDRYRGTEVMIFCPDLKSPGTIEPYRGDAA
jgi:DNA adenine methylase